MLLLKSFVIIICKVSAYVSGFVILAVETRDYCCWWEDGPFRQFYLHEKNINWMDELETAA
jgi:hypothetical protein